MRRPDPVLLLVLRYYLLPACAALAALGFLAWLGLKGLAGVGALFQR